MTSALAVSINTPVGSPLGARTILPPGGSAVAAVTPASISAFAHPDRVAVDATQDHRAIADGLIERGAGRKRLPGPPVLIPTSPDQPLVGRTLLASSPTTFAVSCSLASPRTETSQRSAERGQVTVRVDEAGRDAVTVQVDDRRLLRGLPRDVISANCGDRSAAHDQCRRVRMRGIHRPDVAVDEDRLRLMRGAVRAIVVQRLARRGADQQRQDRSSHRVRERTRDPRSDF